MTSPDRFIGPHRNARIGSAAGYPRRVTVPDDKVRFSVPFAAYAPTTFTADVVLDNDRTVREGGWADPPDAHVVDFSQRQSLQAPLSFDDDGVPQNPEGRTGLRGRGLLGCWGPNHAADTIVTRGHGDDVKVLCIRRRDRQGKADAWALPGGMVDAGEAPRIAASRELQEEVGIDLDLAAATVVYAGYVDDPRNTDQAWMETTALHVHLDDDRAAALRLSAGDDADAAAWRPTDVESLHTLYANHSRLVWSALQRLATTT